MTRYRYSKESGAISGQLIVIACLLLVVVALSGLSAWLYIQFDDQKTNVDSKVATVVAESNKKLAEEHEKKYRAFENELIREFAGPEDYGRVSFKYPRIWSMYVSSDASTGGNTYEAFLNPVTVPPINARTSRFALRVTIENAAYDKVLDSYRAAIQKGDLKSSPLNVNEHDGTRLDGNFTKDLRGSAVLFKVRDKTVTISSEVETFKPNFEEIIKTIDFND